jgi:hypothetical protein
MKAILSVSFLILFNPSLILSQSNCKQYGGNHIDYAFDMIRDPLGNYLITGRSYSFLLDTNEIWGDIYTIKLDPSHQLMWTSIFQTTYEDEGNSMVNAPDGGYMIAGNSYSFSGGYDLTLVKLDNNGNLSWSKLLGTPLDDHTNAIYHISDDAYILGGYTDTVFSGPVQTYVPLITKIDLNGSVVWSKKIGFASGSFSGSVYDIIEADNGSVMVTGDIVRLAQGPEDSDLFIANFSSGGNLNWFKWIGDNCNTCHEMGAKLIEKDATHFIVLGSYTPGSGIYKVGFDINGNILTEHIIQTGNFPYTNISAVTTVDNGLVVTCPALQILAFKIDSTDAIEWAGDYGDGATPGNVPCSIVNVGIGFTVAGYTGTTGPSREDYLMMDIFATGVSCCKLSDETLTINTVDKSDSSGAVIWDVDLVESTGGSVTTGGLERVICPGGVGMEMNELDNLLVYPNPSNGMFYISGTDIADNVIVLVKDVSGAVVYTSGIHVSSQEIGLNLEGLSQGMYTLYLTHISFTKTFKLVIF